MYRAVGGVRGGFESIGGFGSDFEWEVSHVYGSTTLESLTRWLSLARIACTTACASRRIRTSPGQYRCVDPGARATGCIPVNPFAPYTQAMKDYLTVSAGQRGRNQLEDTTAFVSGTLFDLPAGGLKAVLGFERRSFSGFLDYDDVDQPRARDGQPDRRRRSGEDGDARVVHRDRSAHRARSAVREVPGSERFLSPHESGGRAGGLRHLGLRPELAADQRSAHPCHEGARGSPAGAGRSVGRRSDLRHDRGPLHSGSLARSSNNPTRVANCLADGVPVGYAPPLDRRAGRHGLRRR